MRLLAGIRLSNLTDETTSPERQRADILVDPAVTGGTIVDWAEDLDISADKFDPFRRPGLGPWLRERHAEYDGLIFATADRVIRSMMDMYELSKWAAEHRKVIIFVKGPGGSPRMELDFRGGALDPITQLLLTVFAFAGEIELRNIQERTRGSQKLAREEGRWHGGHPPFPYMPEKLPSGKGWRLNIDPEAKKVFQDIADRVFADESLNSICHDLNARGVLTPRDYFQVQNNKKPKGRKWTASVISGILRNKALLGVTLKDGKIVRGDDGLPIMRAEPAMKRSEWEELQQKLDGRTHNATRTRSTSPLLGIPFCLRCGNPRYRYAADVNKREYYRCRGQFRKQGCDSTSVRGDYLSEIIENQLLTHVGDLEILEEVQIPGESHREELEEAEASLADLLTMVQGKPEAVKKVYQRQMASLEALIVRLSALPETPARVEYRSTGTTYRGMWEACDAQERRALLLKAGVRIEVAPANGQWVSVGRFERPERYDQAVSMGIDNGIQYAFYLPQDLIERVMS